MNDPFFLDNDIPVQGYANLDADGYVVSTAFSLEPPNIPGLTTVLMDAPMPPSPAPNMRFHYPTKTWVDTRSEQQKRDDAAFPALDERQRLLLQSDWTQLPNNPLTPQKQAEWATYRQALRDIPAQPGFPMDVAWPSPPT